jgi:glucose-1-phosphate adenylyltransferase
VGTIQAYWEANMDLLRPDAPIAPEAWGIRPNPEAEGRPADRTPARFAGGCTVQNSLIAAGCCIEGTVVNSVLSPGVQVAKGAVVRDSILLHDCVVSENAVVDLAILDKRVVVGQGAVVGHGDDKEKTVANRNQPKHLYTGITLIGKEAEVPANTTIGRNCVVAPHRQAGDYPGPRIATGESV